MKTLTSRLYETEYDLQQVYDLLMKARSRTNDWHDAHVGELAFNYFMVACHLNPQEHIRLWYNKEKLVGYAILGENPLPKLADLVSTFCSTSLALTQRLCL